MYSFYNKCYFRCFFCKISFFKSIFLEIFDFYMCIPYKNIKFILFFINILFLFNIDSYTI